MKTTHKWEEEVEAEREEDLNLSSLSATEVSYSPVSWGGMGIGGVHSHHEEDA